MIYYDIKELQTSINMENVNERLPLSPLECSKVLLDQMKTIKTDTIRKVSEASMYFENDVLELWNAAERFVSNFKIISDQQKKHENSLLANECENLWPNKVRYVPWGTILVCIPANAVVPLSIILPLALTASGNRLIMSFSPKIREVGIEIIQQIEDIFPGRIYTWGGSVRDVVDGMIENESYVDLLYYMGGSTQYPSIVEKCARNGVDLHYEGEGRTIALLDEKMTSEQITKSAKQIFMSKVFCNGMMCSSANTTLVHRECFSDFTNAYKLLCEKFQPKVCYHNGLLENLRNSYGDEIPFMKNSSPCFWEVDISTALNSKELFCPGVLVAPYDNLEDCINKISKTRYKLQISLFSQDKNFIKNVVINTGFARYCMNMNPALQDPCLPWGSYGSSGFSDVQNFYQKGFRKIILEGTRQ